MAVNQRVWENNMNEAGARVRPETRDLKRLIAAALAQQKPSYHGTEPCALLLLEPNCTGLPPALIEETQRNKRWR